MISNAAQERAEFRGWTKDNFSTKEEDAANMEDEKFAPLKFNWVKQIPGPKEEDDANTENADNMEDDPSMFTIINPELVEHKKEFQKKIKQRISAEEADGTLAGLVESLMNDELDEAAVDQHLQQKRVAHENICVDPKRARLLSDVDETYLAALLDVDSTQQDSIDFTQQNTMDIDNTQQGNVDSTQQGNVDSTQQGNVDSTQQGNVDSTQQGNVDNSMDIVDEHKSYWR